MKKNRWLAGLIAMFIILVMAAPAVLAGGNVIQGTCVSYDEEKKILVINDELDKKDKTFDVSTAKVGAKPEKGNTLRVAFKKDGDKLIALKVQNVTKQDIRKG
ncbi:MAG: hypothetical protein HQK55_07845 [Deltaproteobacteria bacterium]|nr:hypothetical protein [Deltaproteobacteria bacterium]